MTFALSEVKYVWILEREALEVESAAIRTFGFKLEIYTTMYKGVANHLTHYLQSPGHRYRVKAPQRKVYVNRPGFQTK